MPLELERPCPKCGGGGTLSVPRWGTICPECQGKGVMLTEDGMAVVHLVQRLMREQAGSAGEQDAYQERVLARREEDQASQNRRLDQAVANLRDDLQRERWAREDLERKTKGR